MTTLVSPLDIAEVMDLPVELLIIVPAEDIPCCIDLRSARKIWCGNEEDHSADVEVLWGCGCANAYCFTAIENIHKVSVAKIFNVSWDCPVHGGVRTHIVLERPLTRSKP